jgi:hypothetical protein
MSPVRARFPRTPAGVRGNFWGLGFRGCGPQKTRPLPPANIPTSLWDAAEAGLEQSSGCPKAIPEGWHRLAGGKARPSAAADRAAPPEEKRNRPNRRIPEGCEKAILDTVPAGTSSSPTVGVEIPRTTRHRLAGHPCLASNATRPAMDLRQRQAQFRRKALLLCKAEGPNFIEGKALLNHPPPLHFSDRSQRMKYCGLGIPGCGLSAIHDPQSEIRNLVVELKNNGPSTTRASEAGVPAIRAG